MRVGSTPHRSVQVPGFDDLCRLTPVRRLYPLPVRRASVLPPASSRPPVARAALAVQLALPLAGCAEDFHLLESAPCRAHKKKARFRGPLRIARNRGSCSASFRTAPALGSGAIPNQCRQVIGSSFWNRYLFRGGRYISIPPMP